MPRSKQNGVALGVLGVLLFLVVVIAFSRSGTLEHLSLPPAPTSMPPGSAMTCDMPPAARGFDRPGSDITSIVGIQNPKQCADRCCSTTGCDSYTYNASDTRCWLKRGTPPIVPAPDTVFSGIISKKQSPTSTPTPTPVLLTPPTSRTLDPLSAMAAEQKRKNDIAIANMEQNLQGIRDAAKANTPSFTQPNIGPGQIVVNGKVVDAPGLSGGKILPAPGSMKGDFGFGPGQFVDGGKVLPAPGSMPGFTGGHFLPAPGYMGPTATPPPNSTGAQLALLKTMELVEYLKTLVNNKK